MKVFIEFDLKGIAFGSSEAEMAIVDSTKAMLSQNGASNITVDLWKDCGWYIQLQIEEVPFTVFVAQYSKDSPWQVTIEPTNPGGFLGKLIGKKSERGESGLKVVAKSVYEALRNGGAEMQISLSTRITNVQSNLDGLAW